MGKQPVAARVAALTGPVCERLGVELVDVEYVKEGRSWFLRVYIDKEGGVDLDDCQAVSTQVSDLLDEHEDSFPHAYYLEVSSPGAERPLKKREDFIRFAGRLVSIKTYTPFHGRKKFTGVLKSGDRDDGLVLVVDGEELLIPWSGIARANLALEI